jgi:D-glycero-D-manno-heptose 1,7-bisphosphate phosphatase
MRPAIFFDRDGTLMKDCSYLADPAGVELLPGAADAVRSATAAGHLTVLVTNQSGVARGLHTEDAVRAVNARLQELLAVAGAHLDALYWCPHHPEAGADPELTRACDCRKPAPGMLRRAARDLDIDLAASAMIGDGLGDMGAAAAAGLPGFLVSSPGNRDLDWDGPRHESAAAAVRAFLGSTEGSS